MKQLTIILTTFLAFSCTHTKVKNYHKISIEDSVELEKELVIYKNLMFNTLYFESQKETYLRNKVNPNDFCYDKIKKWDLTKSYYMNQEFDPRLYFDDTLKDKLIRKWLNKKRYIPQLRSPEYTEGSIDMARALDFYNSDDLAQHIDSLRQLKYKRLMNGEGNISN